MSVSIITIGEFAKVSSGGTPSRGMTDFFSGSIPWIKTLDLNGARVFSSEEKITERALSSFHGTINPVDTVMVAMYGGAGTIGKSGVLAVPAATNQAIASILPNPTIFNSDFLHFQLCYLRSEWMKYSQGNRKDPNINKSIVECMKVWLPNLDIQKRIATEILSQLNTIGIATCALSEQFKQTVKLADSLIYESMKTCHLQKRSLGDVLCEVKIGIGNEWRNYPVMGATRDGIAPAREQAGKNAPRYKPVTARTVFYNPMRILIGSIAFVDDDDTPGITSPDYVVLRGKPGVVDSRWFYHWLRSPLGEKCINSLARGAVRERMLFNRLAEGEIEIPEFPAQERASKALAAIKPMRIAIEKQMKEFELMPKKLLAQFFGS